MGTMQESAGDLRASALAIAFTLGAALPVAALPRTQGMTTRASLTSSGAEAGAPSIPPHARSISDDGRFVSFQSDFAFVAPDKNGYVDAYVHDRQSGTTELTSVSGAGAAPVYGGFAPAISGNGRYIAYVSGSYDIVHAKTGTKYDVLRRDRVFGVTALVSVSLTGGEADGNSSLPSLSRDGSRVAFGSYATDLVAGDGNGQHDIFVRDILASTTARVSLDSQGTEANGPSFGGMISADGRFVAFHSFATNLVPGDTNGAADVFVHELASGLTERISVDSAGAQANGPSQHASISQDGRFVAFVSAASSLVNGDTNGVEDAFVHDRVSGTTRRVSVGLAGVEGNGTSTAASISADGSFVAFQSYASNLVSGDTNAAPDAFLHDLASGRTERLSVDSEGGQGDGGSGLPSLSADGRFAAFQSAASNLVAGDGNGVADVFVRDRECGVSTYCSASLSSALCLPAIAFSGSPSASAGQGFTVEGSGFPPAKPGYFVYGTLGPANAPFLGGTLCAQMPLVRVPVANSGGASSCKGRFALDLNAYVASGADPTLVAGKTLWGQWWAREPSLPPPQNLTSSDAVRVTLCP